jgi:hypothetical protein
MNHETLHRPSWCSGVNVEESEHGGDDLVALPILAYKPSGARGRFVPRQSSPALRGEHALTRRRQRPHDPRPAVHSQLLASDRGA